MNDRDTVGAELASAQPDPQLETTSTQPETIPDQEISPPSPSFPESKSARIDKWTMLIGKGRKRTIVIGTLSIIALVIIISAGVFALMQQQPSGPWESVLTGYTITSLVAAPGDPSVLYACAEQSQTSAPTSPITILFNSKDGGTHWTQLSTIPGDAVNCQIAVNPADSNDLYIVSGPNSSSPNGAGSEQLQHSVDGGQTWITVFPRFQDSALSSLAWYVQHLSLVGNRLYAVQWVPRAGIQPQQGSSPQTTSLPHLIMSVDGGQTWTIVDQEFQAADLELRSYAVNPSAPDTIYELIGRPTLPVKTAPAPSEQSLPVPPVGTNGDLYKSTDSGKQWQAVLKDLPFGAMVRFSPDKPKFVYAGGANSSSPLRASQGGFMARFYENTAFQLHISKDGGTTWQDIPSPANASSVQQWLVGPDGHVYTFSGGGTSKMQSYDLAANQWHDVATPPVSGNLLAAIGGTGSHTTLWLMSTEDGKISLYRYIIHT